MSSVYVLGASSMVRAITFSVPFPSVSLVVGSGISHNVSGYLFARERIRACGGR